MKKKVKIAVIGGGVAGLYAAWRLKTLDKDVAITIYEAADHVGGRVDTAEFAIYRRPADVRNKEPNPQPVK